MKKYLFILLACFLTINAGAQVTVYHDTVTQVVAKNNQTHLIYDSIVNNTANPITVTWVKESQFLLTGWTLSGICDKITCYPPPANGPYNFTINPGETSKFYVDIKADPSATDGNNYITLKINDGVNDKFITFIAYSWPNQVADFDINSVVSIYPNPATNFINLNILDNKVKNINVINIIGKKLATFKLDNSTPNPIRVPLDNISKGVYLLQFSDAKGKVMGVKRITKQ